MNGECFGLLSELSPSNMKNIGLMKLRAEVSLEITEGVWEENS